MLKAIVNIAIVFLIGWKVYGAFDQNRQDGFPSQPIQIVVPYLAGGGTDTFARIIQKSLVENNLLNVPVVIMNQPGGSATIGSRYVKNSRPDGYRILCHHEGVIATKLAGTVPFGVEAFQPIAQTGEIVLLLIVRADSPYQSLPELLKAAQQEPNKIRIGANQGSPAYFICKQLLAEYPGADFNFISADGSRRYSYLLGNKLEAGIFSLAEYIAFRNGDDVPPDQNIKAIANFGTQRHPAIADVATSREQGLTTTASNAYYFWAPKNTPAEIISRLAEALRSTMHDPVVRSELEKLSLPPTFRSGPELAEHLQQRVGAFEKLAVKADAKLPNFPAWLIAIVIGLLIAVLIENQKTPALHQAEVSPSQPPVFNRTGLICLGLLCVYVLLLQLEIPYAIATTVLVFSIGATIDRWQRSHLIGIIQLALLVGLGTELVFASVFNVPLP